MNLRIFLHILSIALILIVLTPSPATSQGTCNSGPGDTLEGLISGGCTHIVMGADLNLNSDFTHTGDLIIEKSQSVSTQLTLRLNGILTIQNSGTVRFKGISIEINRVGNGIVSISNVGNVELVDVKVMRAGALQDDPISIFQLENVNLTAKNSIFGTSPDFLRVFNVTFNDNSPHELMLQNVTFKSGRQALIVNHMGGSPAIMNISGSSFVFPPGYSPMEMPYDAVQININGGSTGNKIYLRDLFFAKRGLSGLQNATLINVSNGGVDIYLGGNVSTEFWMSGIPPRQHTNPVRVMGVNTGVFSLIIDRQSYTNSKSLSLSIDLYGGARGTLSVQHSVFGQYSVLTNISVKDNAGFRFNLFNNTYSDVFTYFMNFQGNANTSISARNLSIDVSTTLFRASLIDSPNLYMNLSNLNRRGAGSDPLMFIDIGMGNGPGHSLEVIYMNSVDRPGNLFNLFHQGSGNTSVEIIDSRFETFSIYGNTQSYFNVSIKNSAFHEAKYDIAKSDYTPLDISGSGRVRVSWSLQIRVLRSFLNPAANIPVNISYMGYTLAHGVTDSQGIFNASLEYDIYDSARNLKIFVARYLTVTGWLENRIIRYRLGLDKNLLGPVRGGTYDVYPDDLSIKGYGANRSISFSLDIDGRDGRFIIFTKTDRGSFISYSFKLTGIKDYIGNVEYIGIVFTRTGMLRIVITIDADGSIKVWISGSVYRLRQVG